MAGEWEGWEKGWEQAVEESMKHRDPAFEELIKAIHIEAFNEKQKMAQKTTGDGACFWHSLAVVLHDLEPRTWQHHRVHCLEYLDKNRHLYISKKWRLLPGVDKPSLLIQEELEAYDSVSHLEKLYQPEWMCQVCADAYQVPIELLIAMPESPLAWFTFLPNEYTGTINLNEIRPLTMAAYFIGQSGHFMPLVSVNETKQEIMNLPDIPPQEIRNFIELEAAFCNRTHENFTDRCLQ